MRPPDETRNGGPVSKTAVRVEKPAKVPYIFGDSVNGVTIVHGDLRLWLREAFELLQLARTEPEKGLRYLALWVVRLGRAMA
jgi:hypothetical protein